MSFRHVTTEYSEDDFASPGTNKGTLQRLYTVAALTGYKIDNTTMPAAPDVGAALTGLNATIRQFEADDLDGTADPTEKVLQAPAGGPLCTRSADGSTLTIAPAPTVPFARCVELRKTLDALGYIPA